MNTMSDNETVEKLKREMEEIKRAIGIEPDFRPLATVYNPASVRRIFDLLAALAGLALSD